MENIEICSTHKKEIEMYCAKCKEFLCVKCLTEHKNKHCSHPSYIPSYIEEEIFPNYPKTLKYFKQQSLKIQSSINKYNSSCSNAKTQLISLREKMNSSLSVINNCIDSLAIIPTYDSVNAKLEERSKESQRIIESENLRHSISRIKEKNLLDHMIQEESKEEAMDVIYKQVTEFMNEKKFDELTKSISDFTKFHENFKLLTETPREFIYCSCRPEGNTKRLCKFNLKTKKISQCTDIQRWSVVTQINSRVFISGGYDPDIHKLLEYIESTNTLKPKANMKYKKSSHKVEIMSRDTFATIGGLSENRSIPYCELYSVSDNKWTNLPSLNIPRSDHATALFLNRHLYAIGGVNGRNSIEKLDVLEMDKWDVVSIDLPNLIDGIGAFSISNTEILILYNNSKTIGIYNADTNTITNHESDIILDDYCLNSTCMIGANVYLVGYTQGNMHIYNIYDKKFHDIQYKKISSIDRKSTRLNSSHSGEYRMPSSA